MCTRPRPLFPVSIIRMLALTLMLVLPAINMADASDVIHLKKKNDGSIVEIEQGETIVISLNSNPTTGYSWNVLESDASILKAEKKEFQPHSNLLGAPGMEILCFTGLRSGDTKLVLGYLRPWEKKVKPFATFSVIVKVTARSF